MARNSLKLYHPLLGEATLGELTIHDELNEHLSCDVKLTQPRDNRFEVEALIGEEIDIVASSDAVGAVTLFSGLVGRAELKAMPAGDFRLNLRCFGRSYPLSFARDERSWFKTTAAAVAEDICARFKAPIDVQAASASTFKRNFVQHGEDSFSFLQKLVDDTGCWIRSTIEGLKLCETFETGPSVEFRGGAGAELTKFAIQARVTPGRWSGTTYDFRTMKSVRLKDISEAPSRTGSMQGLAARADRLGVELLPVAHCGADSRAATHDGLRKTLERESERAKGTSAIAFGESRSTQVAAGKTIEVTGKLDCKGLYDVFKVIHRWSPEAGYRNEFWCTPWKKWLAPIRPENRRIKGVMPARVVSHNDPRKLGRLRIQFDWQRMSQGTWVRWSTPSAGSDRGFHFLPEIGDEVLVGFYEGDPERPYVLGSLWSGRDAAPWDDIWGGDIGVNNIKRIVTKSGHRIQLSDEPGREAIVIATPSRLKITMLERAEESGRSMIYLSAEEGDIVMSAPEGRVHVQAAYFSREIGDFSTMVEKQKARGAASAPTEEDVPQPANLSLASRKHSAFVEMCDC